MNNLSTIKDIPSVTLVQEMYIHTDATPEQIRT